jgi:hypothetical protein
MADSALPHECPGCGEEAPRAFLTAPYLAAMTADRRHAHATNERSASSPRAFSALKRTHGSGCGCCSGKSLRYDNGAGGDKSGSNTKGFPARRPWMISH